jgi:hypothetical protein
VITRRGSFDEVPSLMSEIDGMVGPEVSRVLVGNMAYLEDQQKVSWEEGAALAERYNILFRNVSTYWRKCDRGVHYTD